VDYLVDCFIFNGTLFTMNETQSNQTTPAPFVAGKRNIIISVGVVSVSLLLGTALYYYRDSFIAPSNTSSVETQQVVYPVPWDVLISEGKYFGLDFSDPFLSESYTQDVKRTCYSPQSFVIKNKKKGDISSNICISVDDVVTVYAWSDAKFSLDKVSEDLTRKLAIARKVSTSTKDAISHTKVKQDGEISYYLVKLSDGYYQYRGAFLIDTPEAKKLGVKVLVFVNNGNLSKVEKRINDIKKAIKVGLPVS
jgi:hypothetical protein